jgi:hypothetical protein
MPGGPRGTVDQFQQHPGAGAIGEQLSDTGEIRLCIHAPSIRAGCFDVGRKDPARRWRT